MDPRTKQALVHQFEHELHNLPYPISKKELLRHASFVAGGQDLVDLVNQLPQESYRHAADILADLGFPHGRA